MVAPGAVPLAGWQQLLEDELLAHDSQPRSLPYYAEVLPSYNQTTNGSCTHILRDEKSSPPSSPAALTKKERFMAVLKGETSVYAIYKEKHAASSSSETSSTTSSDSSSKRSFWKHPILTGEHLPMYRLEESVDHSIRRRQASAEYAAYRA